MDELLLSRVKVRPPRDGLEREGDRRWRGEAGGEVDGGKGEGALWKEGGSGGLEPARVEAFVSVKSVGLRPQDTLEREKRGRAASEQTKESETHMSLQKPHDRFTSCFSPVSSSTCK